MHSSVDIADPVIADRCPPTSIQPCSEARILGAPASRRSRFTGAGRPREGGFTLLELLVVLVIIGLLAAFVGPQLLDRLETSKVTTTEAQIRMLKTALDTLRLDIGRYPTTQEGLVLLTEPPNNPDLRERWRGPYLESAVPNDAWSHPYKYTYSGTGNPPFSLYSEGDASDRSRPVKGIGIHPPG